MDAIKQYAVRRNLRHVLCALLVTGAGGAALAQGGGSCGELANAYGPLDYRTQQQALKIVNDNHFTRNVETLVGGVSGRIGGELDYTLRASPNHHRALLALSRLAQRMKTDQVPDMHYTVDCWFQRALRFQPDDMTARMLFVQHLASTQRKPQALEQMDYVVQHAGDNGFTHYNAGLIFLELGEPARARAQAHRAQALGFERPGLQQALAKIGQWQDAPAAVAPAVAASQAAIAVPTAPSAAASAGQ